MANWNNWNSTMICKECMNKMFDESVFTKEYQLKQLEALRLRCENEISKKDQYHQDEKRRHANMKKHNKKYVKNVKVEMEATVKQIALLRDELLKESTAVEESTI
jgi:hypothetical protein